MVITLVDFLQLKYLAFMMFLSDIHYIGVYILWYISEWVYVDIQCRL